MASSSSVLDSFLNLFHCGGEDVNGDNDHNGSSSTTSIHKNRSDILTEAENNGGSVVYNITETETPRITQCPSKATSIYSIPSRDSMMEFREEAAQRSNGSSFRSSVFACTSSPPMQFTFDEYDMDYEKKQNRYYSKDNKEFRPAASDNESTSTPSTAESSSVMEIHSIHQQQQQQQVTTQ